MEWFLSEISAANVLSLERYEMTLVKVTESSLCIVDKKCLSNNPHCINSLPNYVVSVVLVLPCINRFSVMMSK